ncbi:hypothetical protein [Novosphingobium sp.]|uniref:hypothetical protein n=1 Tax=Novosphingobium sp. TaxID=1874826 RepID=UPI003B516D8A
MIKLWLFVIALVLIGISLAAISFDWQPISSVQSKAKTPKATTPDKDEIVRLQYLANHACNCEVSIKTDDSTNCWREYESAVSKYAVTESGTACDPISETKDCFGNGLDDRLCVSRGFDVAGVPSNVKGKVCSAAEAQAVEAAGSAAYRRAKGTNSNDPHAAERTSDNAMAEAILEIRAKKLHPITGTEKICG